MITEGHSYDYDVAVIGAGPGGAEAARELGKEGKKVCIIEGNKLGGTCLNRGCIPAKTMLYTADMYRTVHQMEEYGISLDKNSIEVSFPRMIERRAQIMDKLRKGLTFQLKQHNVEIIEAYATLKDAHSIELSTGKTITADQIVLATGGAARKFPGFVEDDERFLTSDNIFEAKMVPDSMVIVGAGPVGTEFATFFATFGTKVDIVEMSETFLPYFDHNLGDELVKAFKREGINCHLDTKIESIDSSGENLKLTLSSGDTIETQYVLSAIGVQVATDYLKEAGIELEQNGKVKVDETLQTSIPNIHALGDLIGKSGSAYGAEREAKYIAYKLLGKDTSLAPVNYVSMPDVVFTHPELATCGNSAKELKEEGVEFETKSVQFMVNAKAHIKNETRGKIWIYFEKESRIIRGIHVVGINATEIIHQAPIVIHHKTTVEDYLKMVWGHPVLAEIVKECLVMG